MDVISAGRQIGWLLVRHEMVTAGVEHVELCRVLGHLVLVVEVIVVMDHSCVVWRGSRLRQDHALLDWVRDHVVQLHCVLWGESRCVVLEGHYLARFMRHNVCLRWLRIAYLFWILSLGRYRLHDIEGIIPRMLIVVHSHNHVFLCSRLFKQIKERDVPCVRRWFVVVVVVMDNWSILRLFKVVHALLSLHLSFKFMSVGMGNCWKLIASTWRRVHERFNTCRRGNGVRRGPTSGIQRNMRLFITFNQHKPVLVFLKLRNYSLWLALLNSTNSLFGSWNYRLSKHLSCDSVSQRSMPRHLVNIIFLSLLWGDRRVWWWVPGRHPLFSHSSFALFLHHSFTNSR